jgi:hypothetical protein
MDEANRPAATTAATDTPARDFLDSYLIFI